MADAPRDAIGEALAGKLTPEQLTYLMDEVLAITKRVTADFKCRHCSKSQRGQIEIPDAKAVTSSLAELMTQSWGRPDAANQDTEIVVHRNVYLVSEEEETDAEEHPEEGPAE